MILSVQRFDFTAFLLRYLSGRVFVLDLTPGSQADFDKFICRGDVIDEINGTLLRNSKSGQVSYRLLNTVSILHLYKHLRFFICMTIFLQGRSCSVTAEGLPAVHGCGAMEGSGWNRFPASHQTSAGTADGEPQSAVWAGPTPASNHPGTDYLPNTMSQRWEASWLLELF